VLGIVLVCVVVAVMLATVVTNAAMLNRRQLELANWQQQASWLAESGLQRAVHRLHTAPDYGGETWEVPAASLAAGRSGSVVIRVQPHPAETGGRLIRVEARYPSETPRGVLSVCEASMDVPVPAPEENPR
jgi:Tfp pilus assembly protein PilX